MLSNMFKRCGRKVCSCQKELWALRVQIPLERKEHIDLQKKIQSTEKQYKGCYGSYKVMVANLEKVSEFRKF